MVEVYSTDYQPITTGFVFMFIVAFFGIFFIFYNMIYAIYLLFTNPTLELVGVLIVFTILSPLLYYYPPGFLQSQLVITNIEIKIIPPYLRLYWWKKPKIVPRGLIDQFISEDNGNISFFSKGSQVCNFNIHGRKEHRRIESKKIADVLQNIGIEKIYSLKYLKSS